MRRPQPVQAADPRACANVDFPLPDWPHYDDEQIAAVASVLRSGKVNYWNGEQGRAFEREFAKFVGTRHAVAVANGTLALELAIHALDIPRGSEVIVPCRTFIATASAVVAQGCRPVFADVDPHSGTITAETIEPVLTPNTRAVICVHLGGWPCAMDEIRSLGRRHNLRVIEDCAQAHGAEYRGSPVGSLGDAAAFSFCTDKIMSTGGEGGMVTLHDDVAWRRAWSYKDHGKGWDQVYNTEHPGVFRWLHESLGTNWRLTEMQSAMGRIQLRRLPRWVETRRQHAATLSAVFAGHDALRLAKPPVHLKHSYYRYYANLTPLALRLGRSRDEIVRRLQQLGVPAGCGSCSEIYLEAAFQQTGFVPQQPCRVSRKLGETSLVLPVHPTLSTNDVARMGRRIRDHLDHIIATPSGSHAAA